MNFTKKNRFSTTRRGLFKGISAGVALGALNGSVVSSFGQQSKQRGVRNGRLKQSVVSWCFADHWSVEETCQQAKRLGCQSVELINSKYWPVLKKYGLTCAISGIPVKGMPFVKGFNNPEYHGWLSAVTKKAIDESAEFGCPNVITFTG